MAKKKNRKQKIQFAKDGTVLGGFQNRCAILIHCARKAGLNAYSGISPYIITDAVAHTLGIEPAGETPRDRLEWVVDYLIERYAIRGQETAKCSPQALKSKGKYDAFYASWEWRRLRMMALKQHGNKCQCCGAGPGHVDVSGKPVRIVVDHVKPIRKFWELRLELTNLQILCDECNMGKGSWDHTDWRPSRPCPSSPVSSATQAPSPA